MAKTFQPTAESTVEKKPKILVVGDGAMGFPDLLVDRVKGVEFDKRNISVIYGDSITANAIEGARASFIRDFDSLTREISEMAADQLPATVVISNFDLAKLLSTAKNELHGGVAGALVAKEDPKVVESLIAFAKACKTRGCNVFVYGVSVDEPVKEKLKKDGIQAIIAAGSSEKRDADAYPGFDHTNNIAIAAIAKASIGLVRP